MEIKKALNTRITANARRRMQLLGLNQEALAKRSKIDKGNLSRYFSGKRDYTLHAVQEMATALRQDVRELFK